MSSVATRFLPAAKFSLSSLLIVAILSVELSPLAMTCKFCIELFSRLSILLILFIVSVSKPTVYVVVSPVVFDVTATLLPFATTVFESVALIVTSPVVVLGVKVTFVPAFSLSLAKSLAAFCAIVSACSLFTASSLSVPAAIFVIFAPPKFNELSVPFEIVASPIFTLLLNSAEVRPVRALASLIFSVSLLALTPMLLSLRSEVVAAPPLIFSSLFV